MTFLSTVKDKQVQGYFKTLFKKDFSLTRKKVILVKYKNYCVWRAIVVMCVRAINKVIEQSAVVFIIIASGSFATIYNTS